MGAVSGTLPVGIPQGRDQRCAAFLQNEPDTMQRWGSSIYSTQEEARFVRDLLAYALQRSGFTDVKILVWDYNKDILFHRPVKRSRTPKAAGIVLHWYTGDHIDAVRLVSQRYPMKKL